MKEEHMKRPSMWRIKYLVNSGVQIKYALLTILLLCIFTIMLLSAIFLPPIVIFQSTDVPLNERMEAANAILLLHNTIWPGVGAFILFFGAASIVFTHRIAGPMYSLNRTIGRIAAGDLKIRIKFRKGDDFSEIAGEMNRMADNMESLLSDLDSRIKALSVRVQALPKEQMSAGGTELRADLEAMRAALDPYRFGDHPGQGDGT
jgi:methyl-accepting chemotaxis protein